MTTTAENITKEDLHVYEGLQGLEEAPDPHAGSSVEAKGLDGKDIPYVYVYFRDNDKRVIKKDTSAAVLGYKLPDGTRAFSARPWPNVTPFRGSVMCKLHPQHPNRLLPEYASFPFCMSAKLASEYERDRHMEKRHNNEWKAVNATEEQVDRVLSRASQQATVKMADAIAQGGQSIPEAVPVEAAGLPKQTRTPKQKCPTCKGAFASKRQVEAHVKEFHPEPESKPTALSEPVAEAYASPEGSQ
jgi:hypothetical protein|tara:strand:+ start:1599 stop:2330 length:732 start_codon:yes stop_codon:yes gene_type:complete